MQKDMLIMLCSGTGYTSKAIRFFETEYGLLGDGVDWDLLAVPGCIQSLELSSFSFRSVRDAVAYFSKFLVEKHSLKKVVVLDHEGCAWFKEIMQSDRRTMKKPQSEVLQNAKTTLLQLLPPGISLDLWHASLKDRAPFFQKVE